MLFKIDTEGRAAQLVEPDSFSRLEYHERYDIQEWILNKPDLLGEPLLVIATEFSGFDRTSERLDVLALDVQGKLTVVELKRTAIGTVADLQALRYAAYCSTLKLNDVAEMRATFLTRRGEKTSEEEALSEIRRFVELPDFDELDDKPRIILAADAFGEEITATALWLRSYELDIRCVRLTPYTLDDSLIVDSTILIPVPEAEEYMIRREKKEASRSSSGRAAKPTIDEYRNWIPDEVRPLFDQLREAFLSRGGVTERTHRTLVTYRRESDGAWIGYLQFVSTEARLGLIPEVEVPEDMIVRYSNGGWPLLGISTPADVEIGLSLIADTFQYLNT